jgi:hypothetical protein
MDYDLLFWLKVVGLVAFAGLGIWQLVAEVRRDKERISKDKELSETRDSIYNEKLDDIKLQAQASEGRAKKSEKILDEMNEAIKKKGLKFNESTGEITNIQKIENGGSGIQNNGPNYGIQNIGDIYVNAKKELTDKGLEMVVGEINQYYQKFNASGYILAMHGKGNGDRVFQQIKAQFDNQKLAYDLVQNNFDGNAPPQGISYSLEDGKLKILVGDY